MFVLYLVKTGNDFTPYSTVSTASNMKSPYKCPTITWDNNQVTLTVIREKSVYIAKAQVQSVARQFSSEVGKSGVLEHKSLNISETHKDRGIVTTGSL